LSLMAAICSLEALRRARSASSSPWRDFRRESTSTKAARSGPAAGPRRWTASRRAGANILPRPLRGRAKYDTHAYPRRQGRGHRGTRPSEDAGVTVPIEAVGAERIDDAQRRAQLIRALDSLPPKQRLVLELRVFEELPFREVAQIAGCTENAAKVNFHHAVKR